MVVDSDLEPLAGADPARDVSGHAAVVAAQGVGEGHLTVHNLQTHKVVLLVEATVVQQESVLLLGGKPAATERKGCHFLSMSSMHTWSH